MPKNKSTTTTKKPKYVTKTVNTYDPWITLKKFLIQAGLVALVAFLTYWVDTAIPQLMLDYPQYMAILSMVTAVIIALVNYIKHNQDTMIVKENLETGEIIECSK